MKHILFLLQILLSSLPLLLTGMEKKIFFPEQLNEIEKLIVYHKIQKIGKKMVLEMIEATNEDPNIIDESKALPTSIKIRKNRTDQFARCVINFINEQEKEYGYVPEQISEKKDGNWHITIPTNYIGNYTRYWHKQDHKGEYIELYSAFTYKPALMEVIRNYQ